MYNQPRPLRPAKPWEAVNYLHASRDDLGFDAARWSKPDPIHFADAGLVAHSTGFDADRYEPMQEPLTPQAIRALALLDDEHRNEDFAEQKQASKDGSSTNAHLPFVLDVYVPVGVKASPPKEDKSNAQALTPAHDEALSDLPTLSSDAALPGAQPQALTPTESADASATPALDAQADGSQAATEPADLAAHDEAVTDQGTSDELTAAPAEQSETVAQDAPAQDMAADAQADGDTQSHGDIQGAQTAEGLDPQTQPQDAPEAAPEPAPLPVEAGIAPEEVALREAEQFERGLAQGLKEGLEQGAREAREAMAQEVADQCALLSKVTQEVQALVADPKQFFEPLKRLSLHLAEQLVLGELSASSKTIERLVQHCLDEVSHPLQEGVVVELNPDDKKRLQAQGGDFLEGLRLEAMPELKPGSVRVFANDMVVEDLVEHRLHALALGLLSDVPSWQNKSALAKTESDKHSTEHDDDLA